MSNFVVKSFHTYDLWSGRRSRSGLLNLYV